MDGGAWWATVYGVTKSQTRLSDLPLSQGKWIKKQTSGCFRKTTRIHEILFTTWRHSM